MSKIENFNEWTKIQENEVINEFFGLGKLIKSFFASFSEPIKKKVELVSKNIDDKTGAVKDARELSNSLIQAFKAIANEKTIDLKDSEDPDEVKKILGEFITEIKAVFVAARMPFRALVESDYVSEGEPIYEDMKRYFDTVMTKTTSKEFKIALNIFLDDWEKNHRGENLKKEAIKVIDGMMKTFEKKVKQFGVDRLEKLVKLSAKGSNVKKSEIDKILKEPIEKSTKAKTVETREGKQQFIDAINSKFDDDEIEMEKIEKEDGSFDIIIKNVKL